MRLDKVGKRYGIRLPWVVRDASLEIPAGGLVRLEGRNGSGKSTLLRIIAGVSEPSRGKVTGRPVTGYVPERFPPALPFPAREYLSHLGRVHGLRGPDLEARIDACLDRLGGRELGPVPLRNMSKGMSQKVAVAQALLPRSGLLVLDEAWAGLDVEAKAALDEAVAERLAAGASVVFVDHEPSRLAHLGAERWRLESGRATHMEAGSGVAGEGGAAGSGDGGGRADDASGTTETDGTSEAGSPAVVIVVSGYRGEPGDEAQPRGARCLTACPECVRRTGMASGSIVLAEPGSSDAVLRWLLGSRDHVHVLRVGGSEPGGSGPGGDEAEGGR